jgi:hypothetical protein
MGITLATSITNDNEYTIEYQTNASANDYLLKQYTAGTIDLTKYIIAYTTPDYGPGSYTVTIPPWCSSIACILIGGGGGGGSGGGSSLTTARGGGGGGAGGSLATYAFQVSASASINITVGAGGTSQNGSNGGDGGDGGDSSLTFQTNTYTAYGGIGGTRGVSGTSNGLGGAGGGISSETEIFKSVIGNGGSNGNGVIGGNGGGRTKLDTTTTGTKYCENFIATGGTSGIGSGYGAGGKGGGFSSIAPLTTIPPADGTAGYAKVYFYI